MRAIFHLHTVYSGDSLIPIPYLLDYCVKHRIEALFITEHNNMDSYPIAQKYILEKSFPIMLVPCEEIATKEGEVIGMFLKEPIPKALSLEETLERIHAQGGVVAVPHPFDKVRKERIRNKSRLEHFSKSFNCIEVFNARSPSRDNKKALQWAQSHKILPIWGADAHFKNELGNCLIEIPYFDSPASFLKVLGDAKILKKRSSRWGIVRSGVLKWWRKFRGS